MIWAVPADYYSMIDLRRPAGGQPEPAQVHARQQLLHTSFRTLFTAQEQAKIGQQNCQNLVGAVAVPLGVAGPVAVKELRIRQPESAGTASNWSISDQLHFFLPLATTEGALVASLQRGSKAITLAGGATVQVVQQGMTRGPVFRCQSGVAASLFQDWIHAQTATFAAAAQQVSRHLRFLDCQSWVIGPYLFLRCRFDADQAMGMNMVTIATQRAWETLLDRLPAELPAVTVELVALSGNICTDKKTAAVNRLLGRGWWVQAEVTLGEEIIRDVLKTTIPALLEVHQAKNFLGSALAGDAAPNMQIANAAAAVLLATGQDLAHVVDISQGTTTVTTMAGGLYLAVTLPTVPVGVVGGGSWLPDQSAARALIKGEASTQPLTAGELAATVGLAALAGELSGLAALASHQLARAHQQWGRSGGENPKSRGGVAAEIPPAVQGVTTDES